MAGVTSLPGTAAGPWPEDDNISLTSTIEEEFDSEEEWPVNQILAEGEMNGEIHYLSDWAGFPLSSASWEPRGHFQEGLLKDWEAMKEKQKSGEVPKFYISDWRKAVIDHWSAKFRRHEARNRKRKAIGKSTTVWDQTLDDIIATMDGLPKDEVVANTDRKQPSSSTNADGDRALKAPGQSQQQRPELQAPGNLQRRHTTQATPSARIVSPKTPSQASPRSPAASSATDKRRHSLSTPRNKEKTATATAHRRPSAAPGQTINVFAGGTVRNSNRSLLSAAADPNKQPKMLKSRFQRLIEKGQRDKEGTVAPSRMPNALISLDPNNPGVVHRQSAEPKPPEHENDAEKVDEGVPMDIDSADSDDDAAAKAPIVPASSSKVPPHDVQNEASRPKSPKQTKKKVVFWLNQDDGAGPPMRDVDESSLFVVDNVSREENAQDEHEESAVAMPQLTSLSLKRNGDKTGLSNRKACRIGLQANEPIMIQFDEISSTDNTAGLSNFLTQEEVTFTHTCTAHDYLQQLKMGELVASTLAAGTAAAVSQSDEIENLANRLKLSSIGLLCHSETYCILLYPARSEEWEDSGIIGHVSASESPLRYSVFAPRDRFKSLDLPPHEPTSAMDSASRTAMGLFSHLSYDTLLPLHQPLPSAQQNTRHTFCLVFPPSAQHEADLLLQWLQMSNANCDLRCSLVPGHWHSFLRRSYGTVILHEDALGSIYRMPSIVNLLHAKGDSYSFWVFKRPLSRDSIPHSIAPSSMDRSGLLLERVFRPGIAILVTPSFLISQPKQAYNFFKWFWQNFSISAQIYRHGRLVMCADAADWILQLASDRAREPDSLEPEASVEMRFKSAALVRTLLSESSDSPQCPIVCAPPQIDGHDEQSLVNWFCWWSLAQTGQFRRFSIVCSDTLNQQHLTRVIKPPAFDELTLKVQAAMRPESHTAPELLPDETAASLARYLKELEGRAILAAKYWKPLLLYRMPVAEADDSTEARPYTYYGSWLQFYLASHLPRVMQTTRLGGHVRTTYFGLFHTKASTGGNQYLLSTGSRDPWIAILRPTDLNRRPLRSLELLIWDVKLKEKTKSVESMAFTDLSPAQQRLIDQVAPTTGGDRTLPLERVWAGGFKSSHRLTHPLDKTLEFLETLLNNFKEWLPFNQDALDSRGWRQVTRSRPAASYGLANEFSTNDEETVKMVFNPPSSAPGAPTPKLQNRLCQWALDAPDGSDAAFTFVPTMDWYQQQVDAGYGYEHIRATSWKSIFEQYKILDPDNPPQKAA